jgi:hypothetical protein
MHGKEGWWGRTPLNPIHLSPISRMNSAIWTLSFCGREALVELYKAIMDSGEFMVIVAAVEMPSHDGRPNLRSVASSWILWYTAVMRGGAGTGPGRECAALMSCLRAGDSFDMVGKLQAWVL